MEKMRFRHLHGGAFSPTIRGIHENPWRHDSYASQANVRLRVFIEDVQAVLRCEARLLPCRKENPEAALKYSNSQGCRRTADDKGFRMGVCPFFFGIFQDDLCDLVIYSLIAGEIMTIPLPKPV